MFFNKFGECKDGAACKYIHERTKIRVCGEFLRGECTSEKCLLSHQVESDKMPTCFRFIKGECTDVRCPYRHVMVSREAPVCTEFLKGFCQLGSACTKKHVLAKRKEERSAEPAAAGQAVEPKRRRLSSEVVMPRAFQKLGSGRGGRTGAGHKKSGAGFVLGLGP
jgi:hypothetical protein